jgi:hypothetical protein
MPLPDARDGNILEIRNRPVVFSLWPTRRGTREAIQFQIYSSNPWSVIRHSLRHTLASTLQETASAFVDQAEEFFNAASQAHTRAARPLLLYYSFMNLAKAFIYHRGVATTISHFGHGLWARLRQNPRKISASEIFIDHSQRAGRINIFEKFALSLDPLPVNYPNRSQVKFLLPQIIHGHRIWCRNARENERFASIDRCWLMHNRQRKTVWVRFSIKKEDYIRLHAISRRALLRMSGFHRLFQEVAHPESQRQGDEGYLFESLQEFKYSHRPSDIVAEIIKPLRNMLWTNILSESPYRLYYLYLCPANERRYRAHQLLSVYMVSFFLGSITRYQPRLFNRILERDEGSQIEEFLSTIPNQFLYLMASQFNEQDISKPAVI